MELFEQIRRRHAAGRSIELQFQATMSSGFFLFTGIACSAAGWLAFYFRDSFVLLPYAAFLLFYIGAKQLATALATLRYRSIMAAPRSDWSDDEREYASRVGSRVGCLAYILFAILAVPAGYIAMR